jgi:hypothetical protein
MALSFGYLEMLRIWDETRRMDCSVPASRSDQDSARNDTTGILYIPFVEGQIVVAAKELALSQGMGYREII